jgi:hypothetical protein
MDEDLIVDFQQLVKICSRCHPSLPSSSVRRIRSVIPVNRPGKME